MDVQNKVTPFKEAEALKLIRDGRAEGWEMLHQQYYHGLWSAVHQVVRDDALAEDVVQEAFLKAYKKFKRFKGKSKFSTWMYRIAMNQAYDTIRKIQRRQKRLGLFPLQQNEEDTPIEGVDERTGADAAHHGDLRDALNTALKSLNPEQRAVVELRLIQGFSTEETARILRCKKGTVLSRLYYSCQKLKQLLGDRYAEL
ncbi:MAG: sigma-70 family RNA polymerase sigma factor [Verrucomicrobiota bacterium]